MPQSEINPVVHETCATLTGTMCDITGIEFKMCSSAHWLVASYGSLWIAMALFVFLSQREGAN